MPIDTFSVKRNFTIYSIKFAVSFKCLKHPKIGLCILCWSFSLTTGLGFRKYFVSRDKLTLGNRVWSYNGASCLCGIQDQSCTAGLVFCTGAHGVWSLNLFIDLYALISTFILYLRESREDTLFVNLCHPKGFRTHEGLKSLQRKDRWCKKPEQGPIFILFPGVYKNCIK